MGHKAKGDQTSAQSGLTTDDLARSRRQLRNPPDDGADGLQAGRFVLLPSRPDVELREFGLQEVLFDVVKAPQQIVLFLGHLVQVGGQRVASDGIDYRYVEHVARL